MKVREFAWSNGVNSSTQPQQSGIQLGPGDPAGWPVGHARRLAKQHGLQAIRLFIFNKLVLYHRLKGTVVQSTFVRGDPALTRLPSQKKTTDGMLLVLHVSIIGRPWRLDYAGLRLYGTSTAR